MNMVYIFIKGMMFQSVLFSKSTICSFFMTVFKVSYLLCRDSEGVNAAFCLEGYVIECTEAILF